MRRADRLFQIITLLRAERVVTAAELGRQLGVSERTIYRDVADLVACGVPIEGEAGVGYALGKDVDLPPLMFSEDELSALVLGMRMVGAWADPELAARARDVMAKVAVILPERLEASLSRVDLFAPGFHVPEKMLANLGPVRHAVHEHRKLSFAYTRADGQTSQRTVRPLALAYWGRSWTAIAWCELRDAFRAFRPERMDALTVLDETFTDEPGRDLASYLDGVRAERRDAPSSEPAPDRPGETPHTDEGPGGRDDDATTAG